jgi:hypothetical protein
MDEAASFETFSNRQTIFQRLPGFDGGQAADIDRDQPIAKIGVGLQIDGALAPYRRMAGQIDGVGDERRGDIGFGAGARKHSHRIGNAERE